MTTQTYEKGIMTILTGIYSFQDCLHFVASVRKFHKEPILILIDRVPWALRMLLQRFENVILKPAPSSSNPVLASRYAKVSLYQESPFEKTIYMDCDICLLANIDEIFDELNHHDCLITEDVQPSVAKASNLLRVKQPPLPLLQSLGFPLTENSIHYNSGFIAFRKSPKNSQLFSQFKSYLETVLENQDQLLLRDQGAFAAAIEFAQPEIKVISPTYNYLDKWKSHYGDLEQPVKVLHCTYPYRPQYAKDLTRSFSMKVFDKLALYFLPNQVKNPWRSSKGNPSA